MSLVIKGFDQYVELVNKNEVQYFLVLVDDEGAEHRLRVQEETTQDLVKLLYAPKQKVEEPVLPPDVQEATVFGHDEDAPDPEEEEQHFQVEPDDGPDSEEDVPSI